MTERFNMEIKAKCSNPESIRNILKEKNAEFKGLDHQIDTYFNCKTGRLKLREGNIENYLIYYDRNEDNKGSKQSKVILIQNPDKDLKIILENANNITVVVDKKREIYFIENVKFHIDDVKDLGSFIEIEAITDGSISKEKLQEQLEYYKNLFKIKEEDLIAESYSDLLLEN